MMARSTVALLGTLRELHDVLPDYDWSRLEELVAAKQPDLLCVEVDRTDWEANDLARAPIESRRVLAQLSATTEITLVPIGAGGSSWAESGIAPPRGGLLASVRGWLCSRLDRATVGLMQLAGGPHGVNSSFVEHFCGVLCELQIALTDPETRRGWVRKNEELVEGILWAARQDPGRRILVAVDCRRKHWLRRMLRSVADVTLVDFWKF